VPTDDALARYEQRRDEATIGEHRRNLVMARLKLQLVRLEQRALRAALEATRDAAVLPRRAWDGGPGAVI
jgi:hypothetical protein